MSPVAWRHILLNGYYTFQSGNTDSGRYAPNHRLNFGTPVVERP
jgi:hypothetical protein